MSILYVTPVMPQPFGNGLAMRAASLLAALARRFEVHLFVVPVAGACGPPAEFVRRYAARIGRLDLATHLDPLFALIARIIDPDQRARAEAAYPKPYLSRFCTGESARAFVEWGAQCPVSALHVMRLYLAPLAEPLLRLPAGSRPFCVLDLDEDDVETHQRLSRLYEALGDRRAAATAAREAEKHRALAERFLPAFDRVTVCSKADAARLGSRHPAARFAVAPNGYRLPGPASRPRSSSLGPLRLLFVGTFGYFPNTDAALFLCHEVLPALRHLTDREIAIDLAGAGDTSQLREVARDPSVRLLGFVEELAPLYAAADVAVVPMRAGGGTRIKVLEAFAHGLPVVATRLGAEGIDAVAGEHLLLADDPEAFARACLALKERPDLATALAARAAALLAARYGPAQVAAAIAGVYDRREPG